MELRHLRYFVAVAEERNVTRAARRLGIQQPPLSQQLRALEIEVGTPLLTRLPRGVELTTAGEAFLPEARAVLERSELGVARARRAARGELGQLVLGVTTSAALHPLVPRLFGAFNRACPRVSLQIREGNASDLTEAVGAGDVDAAFIRATVSHPLGLECLELVREGFVVALPAPHPIVADTLTLNDLRDEGFILVRRPSAQGMYASLLEACRSEGFEPRVVAEVGRMITALGLVAAGLGVATVPASMMALRLPGLRYVPLTGRTMPVAPLTFMRRAGTPDPILGRMLDVVKRTVGI